MFITNGSERAIIRRVRRFGGHLGIYALRRLVTPFNLRSEYGALDRWLTANLLTHPSWWRVGGYMSPTMARTIAQFADKHGCRRIGQIGFNAGHFACTALTLIPCSTVVSFDIGDHRHSRPAANWLERRFRGRHDIVWGDSLTTVPVYAGACSDGGTPRLPFDLVLVDGDHRYEGAKADFVNCWRLCAPGTLVVMDDIGTNAFDNAPARVWAEAIAGGHVEELARHTYRGGYGFAIGQFLA